MGEFFAAIPSNISDIVRIHDWVAEFFVAIANYVAKSQYGFYEVISDFCLENNGKIDALMNARIVEKIN